MRQDEEQAEQTKPCAQGEMPQAQQADRQRDRDNGDVWVTLELQQEEAWKTFKH